MASKVENRMALAFPDFKMERLAVVIPMISANSLLFIFRCAKTTSKFTTMGIINWMDWDFWIFGEPNE